VFSAAEGDRCVRVCVRACVCVNLWVMCESECVVCVCICMYILRTHAHIYIDTHVHKCACKYVCKRRVLESTIST